MVNSNSKSCGKNRLSGLDIFNEGMNLSSSLYSEMNNVTNEYGTFPEQVEKILEIRSNHKNSDDYKEMIDELGKDFGIDGSIVLDSDELRKSLSNLQKQSGIDIEQVISNLSHYTYEKGDKLVFRNSEYYFLFDGVDINNIDGKTSVNDFEINEVDIDKFLMNLNIHFNGIYQTLKIFQDYIHSMAQNSLIKNKKQLKRKIEKLFVQKLPKKNISNIDSNFIKSSTGLIIEYKLLIEKFLNQPSLDSYYNLFNFITQFRLQLQMASSIFEVDFLGLLSKYIEIPLDKEIKKLFLGMIDAKINIISFMQNIEQILSNKDFLNTESNGKLIFNADQTKSLQKSSPVQFKDFHTRKNNFGVEKQKYASRDYLDTNISHYIDILLGDSNIGLLLESYITPTSETISNYNYDNNFTTPYVFNSVESLLQSLIKLMNEHVSVYENKNKKYRKKYIKKNRTEEGFLPKDDHLKLQKSMYKKLIRLFREENDPLVMISTIQNSYHSLQEKGFDPNYHNLYVLGVNYGGALVGHFARNILPRIYGEKLLNSEPGNIIYSLYDVKNANNFSNFAEYPSMGFSDDLLTGNYDNSKRDWLVVYDDNTFSGETLHNLKLLAEESKSYFKIGLIVKSGWLRGLNFTM